MLMELPIELKLCILSYLYTSEIVGNNLPRPSNTILYTENSSYYYDFQNNLEYTYFFTNKCGITPAEFTYLVQSTASNLFVRVIPTEDIEEDKHEIKLLLLELKKQNDIRKLKIIGKQNIFDKLIDLYSVTNNRVNLFLEKPLNLSGNNIYCFTATNYNFKSVNIVSENISGLRKATIGRKKEAPLLNIPVKFIAKSKNVENYGASEFLFPIFNCELMYSALPEFDACHNFNICIMLDFECLPHLSGGILLLEYYHVYLELSLLQEMCQQIAIEQQYEHIIELSGNHQVSVDLHSQFRRTELYIDAPKGSIETVQLSSPNTNYLPITYGDDIWDLPEAEYAGLYMVPLGFTKYDKLLSSRENNINLHAAEIITVQFKKGSDLPKFITFFTRHKNIFYYSSGFLGLVYCL